MSWGRHGDEAQGEANLGYKFLSGKESCSEIFLTTMNSENRTITNWQNNQNSNRCTAIQNTVKRKETSPVETFRIKMITWHNSKIFFIKHGAHAHKPTKTLKITLSTQERLSYSGEFKLSPSVVRSLPSARWTIPGSVSAARINVNRPIMPNWSVTIPEGMFVTRPAAVAAGWFRVQHAAETRLWCTVNYLLSIHYLHISKPHCVHALESKTKPIIF